MAILCSGGERVSVGRALLGRVGAGDRRAFFEAGRACDVTGGDKRCLTGRRAVTRGESHKFSGECDHDENNKDGGRESSITRVLQ